MWRQGSPADTVGFVLGGTFALTREAVWAADNRWPEGSKLPKEPRAARCKRDGCSVVLETVSHVAGTEEANLQRAPTPGNGTATAAAAAASAPRQPPPAPAEADDAAGEECGSVAGSVSAAGTGLTAAEEAEAVVQKARQERAEAKLPCSSVIVGEEPLLVARADLDGDSQRHLFEAFRRYTLRAVGPGLCTLLELPRSAARRYLPWNGPWCAGLQRMAARRHVTDACVATAHRQRAAFEALSGAAWGPKMARRQEDAKVSEGGGVAAGGGGFRDLHARRFAAEARQREAAADDAAFASAYGHMEHSKYGHTELQQESGGASASAFTTGRPAGAGAIAGGKKGARGSGSHGSGKHGGKHGGRAPPSPTRSVGGLSVPSLGGRSLDRSSVASASVVRTCGSAASLDLGPLPHQGVDVWGDRAAYLKATPAKHQGQWGRGLDAPLPMLVAGVPGLQRGTR